MYNKQTKYRVASLKEIDRYSTLKTIMTVQQTNRCMYNIQTKYRVASLKDIDRYYNNAKGLPYWQIKTYH